jgi:DNA polymerase elongation subunit (family B)
MKTQYDKNAPKTKYTGAFNMHLPGVYSSVIFFDVCSQYPNALISLNLSVDTFIDYVEQEITPVDYDVPLYTATETENIITINDSVAKLNGLVRVDTRR